MCLVAEAPAVVLFIYNRPDLTARVFTAIRRARPQHLFVFADGGADTASELGARIEAARRVTDSVDWPCRVERHYASAHLGVRRRVESGLDHVFATVDAAMVLEDDCVPDDSVWLFMTDMLDRHRDSDRVMSVCGSRRTPPRPGGTSYHFSRYPFLWGWATWRRAWLQYDRTMEQWPALRESKWLSEQLPQPYAAAYWTYLFDQTWQGGDDGHWDVAFTYSSWLAGGLSVVPASNLVTNLGFRPDATHTRDARQAVAEPVVEPMAFPLRHPDDVVASVEEENLAAAHVFSGSLARVMSEATRRVRASR
jgi:hypothetical protein